MYTENPIIPIPAFTDNYIWLIHNSQKQCLVVDPGDATPIINYLAQHKLGLTTILLTHHHNDHTGGVAELRRQFNATVYGPKYDGIEELDQELTQDTIVQLDEFTLDFKVIELPGHTLGHIAYYDQGILFCGDTLFSAGCGRMYEGTPTEFYNSLNKLANLDDKTQVFCTHEYTLTNLKFAQTIEPDNQDIKQRIKEVNHLREKNLASLPSTIGCEKKINPFLRCHVPEIVIATENYTGAELKDPIDVFAALRRWRNNFNS